MNIIIIFHQKTSILLYLYSFNRIQKVVFMIRICLTWFHATVISDLLYFVIQQLLHMKFIYILLGRKLVSMYLITMTLPCSIFMIKFQIHRTVINYQLSLRKMCGSFLLIDTSTSQQQKFFMKYRTDINNMENPRSISVYVKLKATRTQTLKNFGLYLIK